MKPELANWVASWYQRMHENVQFRQPADIIYQARGLATGQQNISVSSMTTYLWGEHQEVHYKNLGNTRILWNTPPIRGDPFQDEKEEEKEEEGDDDRWIEDSTWQNIHAWLLKHEISWNWLRCMAGIGHRFLTELGKAISNLNPVFVKNLIESHKSYTSAFAEIIKFAKDNWLRDTTNKMYSTWSQRWRWFQEQLESGWMFPLRMKTKASGPFIEKSKRAIEAAMNLPKQPTGGVGGILEISIATTLQSVVKYILNGKSVPKFFFFFQNILTKQPITEE
jgi:hypothetical protein